MIERKVKRYILCKLDGREYQPGDTYTSKDQERIDYLTDLGYLDVAGVSEKGTPSTDQQVYQSITKKELTGLLAKQGIDYNKSDTKEELIKLLGGA